ncbi:MAG: preprotein translocase subunit SecY, partial [Pseudonocardiales bacterium]|nr:preprotein translocase subunit SecY [Pseudonocardiales bacterium]
MLGAFANAFKTPDLRRKILFVLFIVVIFRIGSVVPAPGVNVKSLNTCLNQATSGSNANLYNLINLFSG